MEPVTTISTIALIAGFMIPPAPTRLGNWQQKPYQTSRSKALVSTDELISPNLVPAPSEQLAAEFIDTMPTLDRLSCLELELEMYRELNDGWDGPNSRAPTSGDIQNAQDIVSKLSPGLPIPKPMLSATGVVGLYWDTKNIFADIELEADGRFSLFTRRKSGDMAEKFDDAIDINSLTPEWLTTKLAVLLDA